MTDLAGRAERAALRARRTASVGLLFALGSFALLPLVGRDFFPAVDGGQIRLHVRAPAGTRIEETERIFGQVENVIREVIYGPVDEPWGVRRFFVRDPQGVVISVLAHG